MSSSRFSAAAIAGWRRALVVCGTVVLLDQVSKAIVVSSLAPGHYESIGLGIRITNTTNTGLAFGIGQGESFVLVVTAVALALVLVWFALDPTRPGLWLAVGLLTGGAIGNLADVAITLGALGLVLVSMAPASAPDDAEPKPGPR